MKNAATVISAVVLVLSGFNGSAKAADPTATGLEYVGEYSQMRSRIDETRATLVTTSRGSVWLASKP